MNLYMILCLATHTNGQHVAQDLARIEPDRAAALETGRAHLASIAPAAGGWGNYRVEAVEIPARSILSGYLVTITIEEINQ